MLLAPDLWPGPARRVPESAFRVARARRSDGGSTHDDGASSERVRGWSSTWAAEGAALVLDQLWSRLGDDGRLAPGRRSTALGPRGPNGPWLDYTQCASSYRTGSRWRCQHPTRVEAEALPSNEVAAEAACLVRSVSKSGGFQLQSKFCSTSCSTRCSFLATAMVCFQLLQRCKFLMQRCCAGTACR